jgi:hypothetical protein
MSEDGKVKIGCRLPAGYLMRWRGDRVMLVGADGVERSGEHGFQTTADAGIGIIAARGYGETDVDQLFWFGWLQENNGRNEVRSGQIFEIV